MTIKSPPTSLSAILIILLGISVTIIIYQNISKEPQQTPIQQNGSVCLCDEELESYMQDSLRDIINNNLGRLCGDNCKCGNELIDFINNNVKLLINDSLQSLCRGVNYIGPLCYNCEGNTGIVEGVIGNAVKLNGTSYIVINNKKLDVIGSNDFTIEMWFKTDKDTIGDLLFKGDATYKWFSFTQRNSNFNNEIWLQFDDNIKTKEVKSLMDINDNKWHHGVVTLDRDKTNYWVMTMFIDGNLKETMIFQNYSTLNSNNPIVLGRPYTNNNPHESIGYEYWGSIDEFRIYNRLLTKDEISLSYQNGLSKTESKVSDKDILVYLSFDNIQNNIIQDESKNKINGVIYGM